MRGHARRGASFVGVLALTLLPASTLAQDAPTPEQRQRALEDELRELRERVRRLEAAGAPPKKDPTSAEVPAQGEAGGSTPAPTPRAGSGTTGPGQQEPERAPAPT